MVYPDLYCNCILFIHFNCKCPLSRDRVTRRVKLKSSACLDLFKKESSFQNWRGNSKFVGVLFSNTLNNFRSQITGAVDQSTFRGVQETREPCTPSFDSPHQYFRIPRWLDMRQHRFRRKQRMKREGRLDVRGTSLV